MEQAKEEKGLPRRVRVWNDGRDRFNYEVLGTQYTIDPGSFIELPRRTAIQLRGFYPGKNVIVSLRIEPILGDYEESQDLPTNKEKVSVYVCMKCDAEFDSKEKLMAHMKEAHKPGRPPSVQG